MRAIKIFPLCIFLLLFTQSLFAQKTIAFFSGASQVNLVNGKKSENHTSYEENARWASQFGVRMITRTGQKRETINLVYSNRKYVVETFAGSQGGWSANDLNFNLSYLLAKYKFGRYLFGSNHLYFDFGGYVGIPIKRKIRDERSGAFLGVSGGGSVNENASDYLLDLEVGITTDLGYTFELKDKISAFLEVEFNLGASGKQDFNRLLMDKAVVLGIAYKLMSE
ncbi:MAG: hypothetical protein DHS20C18_38970 [Saprospiraceae bacterium]|nr:MAG: hypothetical protein DHS20C18_38970 [Saprospiraceae bacterium]